MPSRRPLLSKPWTSEDDAKLLKLLRQGKHLTVIAALMRRINGGNLNSLILGPLAGHRHEPSSEQGSRPVRARWPGAAAVSLRLGC